jgi:hypothetical protein
VLLPILILWGRASPLPNERPVTVESVRVRLAGYRCRPHGTGCDIVRGEDVTVLTRRITFLNEYWHEETVYMPDPDEQPKAGRAGGLTVKRGIRFLS